MIKNTYLSILVRLRSLTNNGSLIWRNDRQNSWHCELGNSRFIVTNNPPKLEVTATIGLAYGEVEIENEFVGMLVDTLNKKSPLNEPISDEEVIRIAKDVLKNQL